VFPKVTNYVLGYDGIRLAASAMVGSDRFNQRNEAIDNLLALPRMARRLGVTQQWLPNKPDLQKTINDQLELLSTLDAGSLTKQFATDFASSKPGLVMEQIVAAGAMPAKWSKNMRHPLSGVKR
jgi:hypothetical protein